MPIGSGLNASLGFGAESTYGTYVAPTRFLPFESETMKKTQNMVQGGGLAAGRPAQPVGRRSFTTEAAEGGFVINGFNNGLGILLAHMLGSTAAAVQQAASTAYLQTHTVGDNKGQSLTAQVGVPDRGGVIRPKTLKGVKLKSLEFACGVDEELEITVEIDGQKYSEAETLAAPSYAPATLRAFHFGHLSLALGTYGSEAAVSAVRKFTLKLERGMDDDAFYAGATGLKDEPIWNDWFKVSGTIDTDYKTKADFLDRFHGNTPTSMVATWQMPTPIQSTYYPFLKFTLPGTYFTGESPQVGGPGVVEPSVPFECQWDPTNGLVTAAYQSTDTTV